MDYWGSGLTQHGANVPAFTGSQVRILDDPLRSKEDGWYGALSRGYAISVNDASSLTHAIVARIDRHRTCNAG